MMSFFIVGLSSLLPHWMLDVAGSFYCHDPMGNGVYYHPKLLPTIARTLVHSIWKKSKLKCFDYRRVFFFCILSCIQIKFNKLIEMLFYAIFFLISKRKKKHNGKLSFVIYFCSFTIFAIVNIVQFSFNQTWFQFLSMLSHIMSRKSAY